MDPVLQTWPRTMAEQWDEPQYSRTSPTQAAAVTVDAAAKSQQPRPSRKSVFGSLIRGNSPHETVQKSADSRDLTMGDSSTRRPDPVAGLPRPQTFRRQDFECRERLQPVGVDISERRAVAADRRTSTYASRERALAPASASAQQLPSPAQEQPITLSTEDAVLDYSESNSNIIPVVYPNQPQLSGENPRYSSKGPFKFRIKEIVSEFMTAEATAQATLRRLLPARKFTQPAGDFIWPENAYAQLAKRVSNVLEKRRYSAVQKMPGGQDADLAFGLTKRSVSTLQSSHGFPRPNAGRSTLPTLINGNLCDAIPDTMSSTNIITTAYAAKIGVPIDPMKRQTFINACGVAFQSVGEVATDVAFPDDPSKIWRDCRFAVLERCATPLIMGDPFLRFTETLTKFRHRLKKIPGSFKKLWRVCYMDLPRRMLDCSIGGKPVMASADTGSDVDLISASYAGYRGWRVNKLPKHTGYVMLADGSVKKLNGYVDMSLKIASAVISTRFYVLDGLACDALLGDDILDELDAFNRFEDNFVETPVDERVSVCHNINWQETIDSRLSQILQGKFPGRTAAELARQRFQWIGLNLVSSGKNVQAWQEAFTCALSNLDNREVSSQLRANQGMASFSGIELQRNEQVERERQEKHRQKTSRIKQERDRFLGLTV